MRELFILLSLVFPIVASAEKVWVVFASELTKKADGAAVESCKVLLTSKDKTYVETNTSLRKIFLIRDSKHPLNAAELSGDRRFEVKEVDADPKALKDLVDYNKVAWDVVKQEIVLTDERVHYEKPSNITILPSDDFIDMADK